MPDAIFHFFAGCYYDDIKGEPKQIQARNINAYLIDTDNIFIEDRKKPISNVPEMLFGNMPNDGGNFLLTASEKDELLKKDDSISEFIRQLVGAEEFINDIPKFCIKDIVHDKSKYYKADIYRNISRHFKDKAMMRKKVVNWEYCKPLS